MRDNADACICLPDFSVADLASGRLRPLYGNRSAAEVYATDVLANPQAQPIADAFIADKQWLNQNRDAVTAFLELWNEGLTNLTTNKTQLVTDYPHLFSIQTTEDIDWMTNHINSHNWIFSTIYLTNQDQTIQTNTYTRMQNLGLITNNATLPDMDTTPPTNS